MFVKILKETGEYYNEFGEEVNLFYGEVIDTPLGRVTQEAPQDFTYYRNISDAILGEKIVLKADYISIEENDPNQLQLSFE
jgi:hypothetical protein